MKKTLFALLVCIAPFCVLAQLPSYLPTDGLVGWWPFNGNANDESGNGNDGVVNGAILTSNRIGNNNSAYTFNGNDNYISMPTMNNIPLGNSARTLSVWVNPSNVWNQWTLTAIGYGSASTNNAFIFGLGNNIISVQGWTSDYSSPLTYTVNQWLHAVCTYNETHIKIYVNGVLIGTGTNSLWDTNGTEFYFGARPSQGNSFFPGKLDDIGIWNRALTQEEITALYTATPTNGGGGNNNSAYANVPQGISYQAVARNPQGQPLSNTALQVKFTLLSDSLNGAAEYSELHSLTTNDLGLFTTAFGTGTPLSGTFANINWAGGNKFVKIEADQGSGFIEMGTQQMLSVPYSMRSQTSAAIQNNALPVFANNAAALAGGLQAGQMYRTAAGVLMVVY